MRAPRTQNTLARPCTVTGRGYWSGLPNTLTFLPAPAGTGVRFVRTDLEGWPSLRAVAENRSSMSLRTRMISGPAEVDMIEHVMAALASLQIDNVDVRCTAAEMPALDGSSLLFTLALRSAGTVNQPHPRETLAIERPIRVGDQSQWISAEPLPSGSTHCELVYHLDYGRHSPIGQATFAWTLQPHRFLEEVAPARTFITLEEARVLQARGIAAHVTERDLLVFDHAGPRSNSLRFDDECARHKLLDLIGDLALTGCDLVGRIVAHRSGHQLNGHMAEQLRRMQQATAGCDAADDAVCRRPQAA